MGYALLIDFGSTFTKVAVIDIAKAEIIGTAKAHTTVNSNIMDGLKLAMAELPLIPESFEYKAACSSAAGGLKMVAVGLVKDLTAEAARRAALGAGARVLDVFSFELTEGDIEKISAMQPDIILLAGGTDGGNKEILLKNAKTLCKLPFNVPIVIAGNKVVAHDAAEILRSTHTPVKVAGNVMPELNVLKVEEARSAIRELFLQQIVQAKGLNLAEELAGQVLMPTPAAVLKAAELLATGCEDEEGLGELLVVDIGGATTDVHSIASGDPTKAGVNLKGLPEPYAKRTVEGDLGMRYSALSLYEAAGKRLGKYLQLEDNTIRNYVDKVFHTPDYLAGDEIEAEIDLGMGRLATELAVERHCGTLEVIYTPFGASYIQQGKDLTGIPAVIGTGGILVHNNKALEVLRGVTFCQDTPTLLKPQAPRFYLDSEYILSAMGLLAEYNPVAALRIIKKYLKELGGV
jgi:uncharacterized protein (TIGR01319 family)